MCSAAFSFLGNLTPFEAAAPSKLPVQTTAAKPKKEAQVQTELVCFQLLFFWGGNLTCFEAAAVSKAKAKAIGACTFLLRWLLCGRRLIRRSPGEGGRPLPGWRVNRR